MKKYVNITVNYLCIIPFIGLLYCVFIIDDNLVNGIVTGKYFWFYLLMGLVSLTTITSYLINKRGIKYSFADLLISLFCILGIAVTYVNNQAITTKLVLFVLLFVLYLYFRIFLFQYQSNFYILTVFFILTGLIEAIWGLRQLYGFTSSLFNVTGSFSNPGPYAGYLAVTLPMSLHYILVDRNIIKLEFRKYLIRYYIRWLISFSSVVSIMLILPATMSRASWLAALGGCAFVIILYIVRKRQGVKRIVKYIKENRKKIAFLCFFIISLIIICFWGIYYLKKDSADGRTLIWKTSLEIISKHPAGVGLGNFPGSYGEQQAAYFASGRATEQEEQIAGNPEYAFNEFIQVCVELGIIPFLLMIGLFLYVIVLGIKEKRFGIIGSIISLLIFASMSYPFSVLPFLIVVILLMSMCVSKQCYYISDFQILSRGNTISVLCILLVSCTVTIFCLKNRYPTYRAYQDWKKARMFYDIRSYEDALGMYEELFPYLNDQVHFLFEYGQCLSRTSHFEKSNEVLQKSMRISCDPMLYNIAGKNYQALKQYESAEKSFLQASCIVPHRIYPYYLLFKLYDETGDIHKARQIAEQALDRQIKVDSPAIQEMREEIKELLKNK